MDLISNTDHTKIRGAIQNVVDTFCDTDVLIFKKQTSVSSAMEDFDEKTYIQKTIKGFVEYPQADAKKTKDGAIEIADVTVMLGLDDCEAIQLLNANNVPDIVKGVDLMKINGQIFTIESAIVEGAFQSKNVLVMLTGAKSINRELNDSTTIIQGSQITNVSIQQLADEIEELKEAMIVEIPIGLINGINAIYSSEFDFLPDTLEIHLNGLKLNILEDYQITGPNTFELSYSPETGEDLLINYIKAD